MDEIEDRCAKDHEAYVKEAEQDGKDYVKFFVFTFSLLYGSLALIMLISYFLGYLSWQEL